MPFSNAICETPFWNTSLTWNTTNPSLTPCFTSTILVFVPSLFLLLSLPYTLFACSRAKRSSIQWNQLNVLKLSCALMLVVLCSVQVIDVIVHYHGKDDAIDKVQIISSLIGLFTYCLLALNVHLQRVYGFVTSGAIWLYLLLQITCNVFSIPTFIHFEDHKSTIGRILICIEFVIQIILFLLCSFADNGQVKKKSFEDEDKTTTTESEIVCPREKASFPSKLTFWWYNSIARKGFCHPLTTDDLWQVRAHDRAKYLSDRFNYLFQHNSYTTKNGKKFSKFASKINIISILTRQFGLFFLFPCIARLITDLLQLVNPMVIKHVISFVADPSAPLWHGIVFTLIFVITNVINSVTSAYQQHRMAILGMRVRTCLIGAVYRKSLVLAMHSRTKYTTGEITNLMSVDCARFMDLFTWIHYLWTAPAQIGIAFWLLYRELGISVLGGLLLMLLFIPVQSYFGNLAKKIHEKQTKLKDKRMKAISEMLNGIKVLKLYAWEDAFVGNIQSIRVDELQYIRQSGYAYTIFHIIKYGSAFMVLCITFTLYILLNPNHQLTAQKAFVSVALFNMLRQPMARMPNAITGLIMTTVSIKRINKFLNSDEIISYINRKMDDTSSIMISNASFNWDLKTNQIRNKTSFTLSKIDLTVAKGSLVAVVGSVGSGKSSLLLALLGEMNKLSGELNISSDQQRVAYVAQQSWIQNNSVRENILFGQNMDAERYNRVIDACELRTDLKAFPAGDLTQIGEKGINLSGGQKQRISIARACYSDADLYLLDDPLSAVDSHVSKHIFAQVLHSQSGILHDKTRILVTNDLNVLPNVDQIALLQNGTIAALGNYDQLLKSCFYFRELISHYANLNNIQVSPIEQMKNSISSNNIKIFKESNNSSEKRENFETTTAEQTQTGLISLQVYKNFIKSISPFWLMCILPGHLLMIITITGSNMWLSVWTSNANADSKYYLLIYTIIGMSYLSFVVCSWLCTVHGTLRASRALHWDLLNSVVHSPMQFFDTTPLGRVLNRFSKDIDVLDTYMSQNFRALLNTTLTVLATLFVVSFQTPLFLVVAVPFIGIYFFIQRFHVATSRQLKRLESVTRSPIFSHFSESLNGVCTIKAFSANERFIRESDRRVDENQRCMYPNAVSLCWLQIRLDFMANCLVFFASLFAVLTKRTNSGDSTGSNESGTGLSLSYALSVTSALNMCVRWIAEFENNIVSVERIAEYTNLKSEAAWKTKDDTKVSTNWPRKGVLKFEHYGTRYRTGLDLVLKNVNFCTKSGEKIGVVGRTGAGKTSLTLALFRIIEAANGKIVLDGIDISLLGLQTLRSRISIIPQDPVLFCGTVRSNLDPFSIYSDDQLWHILELSHLKSYVANSPHGLAHPVTEGGENLSMGQRQLICLGRALLRQTKILVLDEATAAVDLETDSLIQSTIRSQFAHCTVITIAHRLQSILESDRVLVLDGGNVAEFDSPAALLSNETSIFHLLAKDARII